MKKPAKATFANKLLIQARMGRHWSQLDVAEKIGQEGLSSSEMVDQRTVRRWESGQAVPSSKHLALLLQVFQKESPDELGFVKKGHHPFWNLADYPKRDIFFTEREVNTLEKVYALLSAERSPDVPFVLALIGLSGIGKTQLAVEYAYQYQHEYQTILWIPAESPEVLLSQFAAIATLLNLPEQTPQNPDVQRKAVKKWLSERGRWLLIFDDVVDVEVVSQLIPFPCWGHILVTTQMQATGRFADTFEVQEWTPKEGAELLLKRAKIHAPSQDDYEKAEDISQAVGGLPLVLDQAGAYLEETGISLAEYINRYQTQREELLKRRGAVSEKDHPLSIVTALSLAFEKVQRTNPEALELLSFLAFLHTETIPMEIISEGARTLTPVLYSISHDLITLDNVISYLRKYSLVKYNKESRTYLVHKLIQDVIQDRCDKPMKHLWATRTVQAVSSIFPEGKYENWLVCDRLLAQAQMCQFYITEWNVVCIDAAQLLHNLGTYFLTHAQYASAEELYTQALALYAQLFGQDHASITPTLCNLGLCHYFQYKNTLAIETYQKVISLNERFFSPTHQSLVQPLRWLGHTYESLQQIDLAERCFLRAQNILEQQPQENKAELAAIKSGLGSIYYKKGAYIEAEAIFQSILKLQKQLLGKDHPSLAVDLKYLGLIHQAQGKYQEAEQEFKKTLAIREKALGPSDLAVAESLTLLAELYQDQQQCDEALLHLKRAVKIVKSTLGSEHPMMAEMLQHYSQFLQKRGKVQEARAVEKRIQSIIANMNTV